MITTKVLEDACNGINLDIFLEKIQGKKLKLSNDYSIVLERFQSFGGTNDEIQIKSKILFAQVGIIFEEKSQPSLRAIHRITNEKVVLQLRDVQERCFYICNSMYFAKLIKQKTIRLVK